MQSLHSLSSLLVDVKRLRIDNDTMLAKLAEGQGEVVACRKRAHVECQVAAHCGEVLLQVAQDKKGLEQTVLTRRQACSKLRWVGGRIPTHSAQLSPQGGSVGQTENMVHAF